MRLDLFSKLADEHAQVFRLLRAVGAPHGGQKLAMRHNLVRIAREIHQQIKFFRSQLDFAIAHGNDVSIEIAYSVHRISWFSSTQVTR